MFEHKELVMCDVYWCPLLHNSTSTLLRTSRRVSTELWRCWSEPSTDPPLTYGAQRVWYELIQCWSNIYFSIKTLKKWWGCSYVDLSFLLVSCERAVIWCVFTGVWVGDWRLSVWASLRRGLHSRWRSVLLVFLPGYLYSVTIGQFLKTVFNGMSLLK